MMQDVNSDLVSLIVDNKNEIVKLQRVVCSKAPMTTYLDMGGYRILNVAHQREPREYESDLLTAKTLYGYMVKVDQNYMRRDRDGSLDGRLNISNHRISGLADLTDADDAVTRRYMLHRGFKNSVMKFKELFITRESWTSFKTYLGLKIIRNYKEV